MTNANPWIVRRSDAPRPKRLYCFSYAGGSAATYFPWQVALAPDIEIAAIQLPGRGARFGEAPLTSLASVIEQAAYAIAGERHPDFAFFGHSLGALLAFEVARFGAASGFTAPVRLILSGCNAPRHRTAGKQLHLLSDDGLIAQLEKYNGTPPEILREPALMELVLPVVRADFSLVDAYRYQAAARLNMPITVLAGTRDSPECNGQADRWPEESTAGGTVHWFDGDHFFIHSHSAEVLACLRAVLMQG